MVGRNSPREPLEKMRPEMPVRHPCKRTSRPPKPKPLPADLDKFVNTMVRDATRTPLLATCRQLLDDGVSHDEIIWALIRIAAGYLKASDLPIEVGFRKTD